MSTAPRRQGESSSHMFSTSDGQQDLQDLQQDLHPSLLVTQLLTILLNTCVYILLHKRDYEGVPFSDLQL
jgi:hypothetical protein